MQKKRGLLLKNLASVQVFLIVLAVFSFAFLTSDMSFVEGAAELTLAEKLAALEKEVAALKNPSGTGKPGLLGNIFGDTPFGTSGLGASLVSGLIYGGIAYGVGYLIGSLLGLDDNNTQALSTALGVGVFVLDRKA